MEDTKKFLKMEKYPAFWDGKYTGAGRLLGM